MKILKLAERMLNFAKRGGRQMNLGTFTPKNARARFSLRLGQLLVGSLAVDDGRWTFRYSDEFRQRADARPLPVFPDLHKTYVSEELFPFFRMRVPSLKRKSVRAVMAKAGLPETDQVALLREFGRRTISNPFELVEDQAAARNPIVVNRPEVIRFTDRAVAQVIRSSTLPFLTATYQITTDDRQPVTAGLFRSADEIFNHIRSLDPGVYHIFQVLSGDGDGMRQTFWGEVKNLGDGRISYAPKSSAQPSAR
jgi:HipA-like protein